MQQRWTAFLKTNNHKHQILAAIFNKETINKLDGTSNSLGTTPLNTMLCVGKGYGGNFCFDEIKSLIKKCKFWIQRV